MSESQIAERYAKSLIILAQEKNVLDSILADMQLIAASCKGSRDLVLMLRSPIVKFDKKLAILNAIFKSKVHPITSSFFELLAKKQRESLLYPIAIEFINEYNKLKGILTAKLYTSTPIDDTLRAEFGRIVEEKTGLKAEIEEYVKEDLIGGYILRIGDMQIDNSVKTKLNNIKKNFSVNHYIPKI